MQFTTVTRTGDVKKNIPGESLARGQISFHFLQDIICAMHGIYYSRHLDRRAYVNNMHMYVYINCTCMYTIQSILACMRVVRALVYVYIR
jgi:hypothetical protein